MSYAVQQSSRGAASSAASRGRHATLITGACRIASHGDVRASLQRHACAQWQEMRMQRLVGCHSAESTSVATAEPAAKKADASLVTSLDIRVGQITKCEVHPDADTLYIEEIEVGEEAPRTIVSGLVKYVPLEQMQGRQVVVLCNLKPRNMRGTKSNGMVLCASSADHNTVEPLLPPAGSAIGERVWFGEGNEKQPPPAEPNRVQKKKIWEEVQPLLRTRSDNVAACSGLTMLTSAGPVTVSSLADASIA